MVLAGCQNMEDQIGARLAESLINTASNGEVKVSIEDLEKGKINLTTKDGTMSIDGSDSQGNFTIKDESGKTMVEASGDGSNLVIKDESGKEVMRADEDSLEITDDEGNVSTMTNTEGDSRPEGAPSDLPSPDGAVDFNYFTYNGMISLTYAMEGEDLKGNCSKVQGLVEAAGWKVSTDGFNFETADSISKTYANSTDNLIVMCGLNDGRTTIGLQQNPLEQ